MNLRRPSNHAEYCQAIVDIVFSNAPLPIYKAYVYESEDRVCVECGNKFIGHSRRIVCGHACKVKRDNRRDYATRKGRS